VEISALLLECDASALRCTVRIRRRAVLERLGAGSATITELAAPFGMSLTGMKKHVRLLEEAELVTTEKVGRARRCMLVPYAFEGISTWLQRLDRFAQVVERTKGAR
jgi:DNA-binding transcriptional ArsR family regulator